MITSKTGTDQVGAMNAQTSSGGCYGLLSAVRWTATPAKFGNRLVLRGGPVPGAFLRGGVPGAPSR